jgi:hypothetical protein
MSRRRESRDPGSDLRAYRRQSDRRLLYAVVVALVAGGLGLIGLIYGWPAMLTAMPCLVMGAVIIALIYFILALLERLVGDD